jgi:Ca2+:H+ antiporter
MAVCSGSSIQVALFVAPLLVLAGLVLNQPMDPVFTPLRLPRWARPSGSAH